MKSVQRGATDKSVVVKGFDHVLTHMELRARRAAPGCSLGHRDIRSPD